MTGIAIGAALGGLRPVMVHQRLDFFLLTMDQLVNNAAKWYFMFGGQQSVPITIRLITGMGWGQGPTHSQSLHSWFAHIPGLKVVIPTNPADAKGMLIESIFDDNPVLFIEHRWLHNQVGHVPKGDYRVELGKASVKATGDDITIVSTSYLTIEALRAVEYLKAKNISCDLIDVRTVAPMDWETIVKSVRKTGHLLVLDSAAESFGMASEIVSHCVTNEFSSLRSAPRKICLPDCPVPTSYGLTQSFYPRAPEIAQTVESMLERDLETNPKILKQKGHHDVPGEWFRGPF